MDFSRFLSPEFRRIVLAALAMGLVAAAAPSLRADREPETPLGEQMDVISKSFRALRKQIADPAQNENSLTLVAKLHDAAVEALKFEPAKTKDLPEAERAKFVENYRAGMKQFIATADQLSAALKAGKNDQAKELLGKLNSEQKEGHKEFRKHKEQPQH